MSKDSLTLAQQAEGAEASVARVVEVLALFGSTVVDARHLTDPRAGRIGLATCAGLVLGAVLLGAGAGTALVGYDGTAALMFLVGTGIMLLAVVRALEEEQQPHFLIGDDPRATFHVPSDKLPSRLFPLVPRHREFDGFTLQY